MTDNPSTSSCLVAGATGLIGRHLLSVLAENDSCTRVHVLLRRKMELPSKVIAHVVDFEALDYFPPPRLFEYAFCALGTTIRNAGSDDGFRRVDFDYVLEFARLAARARVGSLVVVSSVGADPHSRNFYLRTKGEMEEAVGVLDIPSITFVRPSLLLGTREEFRFGERIATTVLPPLSLLMHGPLRKYRPIHARDVAQVMLRSAEAAAPGVHSVFPATSQELALRL